MQFIATSVQRFGKIAGAQATRFFRDDSGATAVEYGILVGLISLAIAGTLIAIGGQIRDGVFAAVSTAITGA